MLLAPISLIHDFSNQNACGNVSKISVNACCTWLRKERNRKSNHARGLQTYSELFRSLSINYYLQILTLKLFLFFSIDSRWFEPSMTRIKFVFPSGHFVNFTLDNSNLFRFPLKVWVIGLYSQIKSPSFSVLLIDLKYSQKSRKEIRNSIYGGISEISKSYAQPVGKLSMPRMPF